MMTWKVLNFNNSKFNAILGQNILKAIEAKIDLQNDNIEVKGKLKIQLCLSLRYHKPSALFRFKKQ